MMKKKGQSGTDAWILVGLISLAMIFFIIFLPPGERAKLLDSDGFGSSSGNTSTEGDVILKKNIGNLEYFAPGGFEHPISSISIFETKESKSIEQINPFIISRGWFTNKDYEQTFRIDDLEHISDVLLTFDAAEHKGVLIVTLNDVVIYEGEMRTPTPIPLRTDRLREENTIHFRTSSVGAAFWRVNKYQISNAQIIGDFTDLSRQKAMNTFTISPTEKRNMLDATLTYIAECDQRKVSTLTSTLNNAVIFSGVPDCGTINRITIPSSVVMEGSNSITFQTTQGTYNIQQIIFKSNLKEIRTFIDYFEIDQDTYQQIVSGGKAVFVEVDFVDDGNRKRAQLNLNGHLTFIDQVAPYYARNVVPWVLPGGRNYLEIVPETALNIAELRVVLR